MINQCDVIIDFVEEYGWSIKDRINVSDSITMLWIERPQKHHAIWSLNFVLKNDEVKVLNRYKDQSYVEAEVDLCDPQSLDSLEKVLQ